jgi:hypothetical protein
LDGFDILANGLAIRTIELQQPFAHRLGTDFGPKEKHAEAKVGIHYQLSVPFVVRLVKLRTLSNRFGLHSIELGFNGESLDEQFALRKK